MYPSCVPDHARLCQTVPGSARRCQREQTSRARRRISMHFNAHAQVGTCSSAPGQDVFSAWEQARQMSTQLAAGLPKLEGPESRMGAFYPP